MGRSRKGKRNRDRQSRRPVVEESWAWDGREELRARLDSRGVLHTVIFRPHELGTLARMRAAEWLQTTFLSHLTFRECFRELWGEDF